MLPNFSYIRPESLKEVHRQLASDGTRVHAGGTDLLGCLHDGVFGAEKVVSLQGLKELSGIRQNGSALRIGALTTITEVERDSRVKELYPVLSQAASEVASPQLRHQGTIGGNLCQKPRCWYYRGEFHCLRKGGEKCFAIGGENQFHCILGGSRCFIVHPSDTAPALMALDAEVRIVGSKGSRMVPVAEFHVPPAEDPQRETVLEQGEIVTEILIPSPPKGMRSRYRKVRARQAWDFALAGSALTLQMEGNTVKDCRVVLSGAAPVSWRSREAEEALRGRALTEETIRKAAAAAMENARPLRENGYKISLFKGMLEEELGKLAGRG